MCPALDLWTVLWRTSNSYILRQLLLFWKYKISSQELVRERRHLFIYFVLVCLFLCLLVSIKRQNGWTDWAQILCWTSHNPREYENTKDYILCNYETNPKKNYILNQIYGSIIRVSYDIFDFMTSTNDIAPFQYSTSVWASESNMIIKKKYLLSYISSQNLYLYIKSWDLCLFVRL